MTGSSRGVPHVSILAPVLFACLFFQVAAAAGVNPPNVDPSLIPWRTLL